MKARTLNFWRDWIPLSMGSLFWGSIYGDWRRCGWEFALLDLFLGAMLLLYVFSRWDLSFKWKEK